MILGEVASIDLANAFISLTQSGTKATYCTCHCVTTEDLVDYFRNAMLLSGTFSNEMKAEEQVANAINIDIHWEKTPEGHRYISHITEIVPSPRNILLPENDFKGCIIEALKVMTRQRAFITRDIIVFKDGRYVFKNNLSDHTVQKILRNLKHKDRKKFLAFNDAILCQTAS